MSNSINWDHVKEYFKPREFDDPHYPGSGKNISSMLICRVYRDTGDTWATNTAGNCPILLEIDFHFPIDALGSASVSAK